MAELIPCLSLWQPWGSLLLDGVKFHETRSWPAPPKVIGRRFVIQAAKRKVHRLHVPVPVESVCLNQLGTRWGELPKGVALGTALLVGCEQMPMAKPESPVDLLCGDWTPGRYAWRFEDRIAFPEPIPLRGRQGIFYEKAERFGL